MNEDLMQTNANWAVSMKFQLVCAFLSLSLFSIIFFQAVNNASIHMYDPGIQEITPVTSTKIGGDPFSVSLGMTIKEFPLFNMRDGKFIVDMSVFFVFDPLLITLDRIGDFVFLDSEMLLKSEPFTKIIGSQLFARYDVRLSCDFKLAYKRFPLEAQELSFVLVHPRLTPGEIQYLLVRSGFSINPNILTPGWKVIDHFVTSGYGDRVVNMSGDERTFSLKSPMAAFIIDFMRAGVRQSFTIFIPLLLLFLIALFTLSFDPFSSLYTSGIGLSATVITALIGYRFVIENMSPKAGNLMISDYVYLVFLAVCCVIFLINIFSEMFSRRFKSAIVALSHMVVVGSIWYCFVFF